MSRKAFTKWFLRFLDSVTHIYVYTYKCQKYILLQTYKNKIHIKTDRQ